MPKTLLITVLILGVIAGSGFLWWQSQPCRSGCNVILIMIDTLSAKHLATYGYDRDTMPKTTAFFEKEGVIFENANSNAPWTLPSFNSMYFSDIPSRITYADLENETRPSLQSELRSHGIEIRAVVPGLNGVIFDAITRRYKKDELQVISDDKGTVPLAKEQIQELTADTNPFFLLIHTFEAHDPYEPRPPYNELFEKTSEYPSVTRDMTLAENFTEVPDSKRTEIYRLRYDQQISQTDTSISEILKTIPKESLNNTVVILAADHGEAFGEHGILNHAAMLFQEEIHIPLMMRIPGVPQKRITEAVSLMDITPTILSFMNIAPQDAFKGDTLLPLITGKTLGVRVIPSMNGYPYYFAGIKKLPESLEVTGALGSDKKLINVSSVGIRVGAQRVFFMNPPPRIHNGLNWYNLENDPKELNNLAKDGNIPPDELMNPLNELKKELTQQ